MDNLSLLADGAMDFLGGQDASKIPDKIEANCYAAGVNISVKRGSITPRWGFERLNMIYPSGGITDKYNRVRTYEEVFKSGKFQAVASYYVGTTPYIIIAISGIIFALDTTTHTLSVIPITGSIDLNARAARLNWTAAGKYLVIYDYPNFPVVIENLTARRADPALYEIPVSTQGAFNNNRLFVANNINEFIGGNPVSFAFPTAPVDFSEALQPAATYYGQAFQLPTVDHNDPITYMGFLQTVDVSTGIGPLIVASNRAIYSYATQNPRSAWESGPFGSIVNYNAGVVGPRAWCNVNSDAFFLSSDGYVRSLSMSRDEQHKWSKIPISREVENWFTTWDQSLIQYGFVSYFKNKIFFSVNPFRVAAQDFKTAREISDYAHGGMVVMELDNLTSFGEASKPTWAGLWTGIRPMDMVNLGDRCFVMSKDAYSDNELYEINPELSYDTADKNIRYVRSRVYTREYDFKDPFANKELHSLDVNFDSLQGDFEFEVKYKPSHAPCFYPWRTVTHKAPWRACAMPVGCLVNGFAPHHIRDFTIGAPIEDLCSPITTDFYKVFRKVQLEITITGKYWEIHEYRIKAMNRPILPTQTICEEYPKVALCNCCHDDWFIGEFDTCQKMQT